MLPENAHAWPVEKPLFSPTAFEQWCLAIKLPQIRYVAAITALLYFVYAGLEYSLHLNHPLLRLLIHGVLVPGALLLTIFMTLATARYQVMRLLLAFAPVFAATAAMLFNMGQPHYSYFSPELYLNIVWTFTLSGLSFRYAFCSISLTLVITALLTVIYGVMPSFLNLHLLWTVSAFCFGAVTAWRVERMYRMLYQQKQALEYQASVDGLTQLWNRTKLITLYEQENTQPQSQPMSLVLIDVDYFKRVNDQHGHAIGDQVLIELARLLHSHLRKQDHLGRIGGEEFCIVLPASPVHLAAEITQRLQQQIRAHDFPVIGQLTVSFGLAERRADESFAELLKRADGALYQAKEQGRDCLIIATS